MKKYNHSTTRSLKHIPYGSVRSFIDGFVNKSKARNDWKKDMELSYCGCELNYHSNERYHFCNCYDNFYCYWCGEVKKYCICELYDAYEWRW